MTITAFKDLITEAFKPSFRIVIKAIGANNVSLALIPEHKDAPNNLMMHLDVELDDSSKTISQQAKINSTLCGKDSIFLARLFLQGCECITSSSDAYYAFKSFLIAHKNRVEGVKKSHAEKLISDGHTPINQSTASRILNSLETWAKNQQRHRAKLAYIYLPSIEKTRGDRESNFYSLKIEHNRRTYSINNKRFSAAMFSEQLQQCFISKAVLDKLDSQNQITFDEIQNALL